MSVAAELAQLVEGLRAHSGLTSKKPIKAVAEYIDTSDPVHGPGDDGAVVELPNSRVIACGEALFPPFVAADPHGAGIAAVLANVNDVAAMGGIPYAIVNTIVAQPDVAAEVMRGMRDAAAMYEVDIVGGHLTEHDGPPNLSAFAVGDADKVLSMANIEPGQKLVFVCSLDGHMRDDFPFFTSIENQTPRLARDIRLLHEVANNDLSVAAKDVSMAGPIGSLGMLLEFTRCGASVDLDLLPTPSDTDLLTWLCCFPTYGFWLAASPETADALVAFFEPYQLKARVVAEVTADPRLRIARGETEATVMDMSTESITGLWDTTEDD